MHFKVYLCINFVKLLPIFRSNVNPETGTVNYTVREAVGVAGLISPWNLPLYLLTFKLAPALMCGNTIVAKPSEMTSITAYMFCKVLQDAGNFQSIPCKVKCIIHSLSEGFSCSEVEQMAI